MLISVTREVNSSLLWGEFHHTRALGCAMASFTLVHVGDTEEMPTVHMPERDGWTREQTVRHGEVVEQILQVAAERSADLIVMTTQDHHGFLDALRGSTTERVLRGARCPLLAVPAA
jgi:universal stress protein family protein